MNELLPTSGSALLPLLVAVPLIGAILLAFIPKEQEAAHRGIGVTFSIIALLMSIPLVAGFDLAEPGFQPSMDFHASWIDAISARFSFSR